MHEMHARKYFFATEMFVHGYTTSSIDFSPMKMFGQNCHWMHWMHGKFIFTHENFIFMNENISHGWSYDCVLITLLLLVANLVYIE